MKKIKVSLTVGLLGLTTIASAQYTGRVFVDQNNNGSFDKNEKLLSNVCVSDGLHVVKTDSHVIYHLEGHERMRFIFITTPSGYKTDNAYYRHVSEGVTSYDSGVQPYNSHVASDGVIYGLDRKTGQQQWKHTIGAPCFSTVTVVCNSLYAADFGGNVYGFTSAK